MAQSLRCTGCVLPGFLVVETADSSLAVQITVRSTAAFSPCPVCGEHSFRVHSRYQRFLLDLPLSGRNVRLHLQARRFHCDVPTCRRRIFAERFDPDVRVWTHNQYATVATMWTAAMKLVADRS